MDKKNIKRIIENLRLNGFELSADRPDRRTIYRVSYTTSDKHSMSWNFYASELEAFWQGINALWNSEILELKSIVGEEWGYPLKIGPDIVISKRKVSS
jgi:hypothetical protein